MKGPRFAHCDGQQPGALTARPEGGWGGGGGGGGGGVCVCVCGWRVCVAGSCNLKGPMFAHRDQQQPGALEARPEGSSRPAQLEGAQGRGPFQDVCLGV